MPDVMLVPPSGRRFTFDVRTVNGACASALTAYGTAAAHLAAIERQKTSKYAAYYTNFRPLVITLTGALSEASRRAVNEVAKAAMKSCEWAMEWEPARWADMVSHRMAVAMVRTIASVVLCVTPVAANTCVAR